MPTPINQAGDWRPSWTVIFPAFFRSFFPIALLILLGALVIGHLEAGRQAEKVKKPELLNVIMASEALENQLARPIRHLLSLAMEEPPVQRALNQKPGGNAEEALKESFQSMLVRNPEYAQIRWFNDKGKEIIRANQADGGNIWLSREKNWQDRNTQYYFQEARKLRKGTVYISPLDLNVEDGQLYESFQPKIQLITRIFRRDDTAFGMFVLTLNVHSMLRRFIQSSGSSDAILLNHEGYWIQSPRSQHEQGVLLNRSGTFGQKYPAEWGLISSSDDGQTETANGLWTWKTVHVTGNDSDRANLVTWKVVSNLPHAVLKQIYLKTWLLTLGLTTALLSFFAWGKWNKTGEALALKIAGEQILEKNRELAKEVDEHRVTRQQLITALSDLSKHRNHLEMLVAERTSELETAKEAAEAANTAKSQFLANMSHELRTPLHQIASLVNLLMRMSPGEAEMKRLAMLEQATQRMTEVVGKILKLSALEARNISVNERPVDINLLLRDVTSAFQEQAKSKGLELLFEPFPVSINLTGAPEYIKSALVCYTENAIRFTETGSVRLSARLIEEASQSILLRLSVEDTGVGIAPEAIPRLFTMFEQADNSSTRKYGGTGLGLAIAKKLAELMGGNVGCSSTPGDGSQFWFTIRLRKAPDL